jgi:hypothetical protein
MTILTDSTHEIESIPQTSFCKGTSQIDSHTISRGLALLPKGTEWKGSWHLVDYLLVEIQAYPTEIVAVTYLTVREYGIGDTQEAAVEDLLESLGDYRQSLEAREEKLADDAREDLAVLRSLIKSNINS